MSEDESRMEELMRKLLVTLVALLGLAPAVLAQPALTVEKDRIRASGITPGAGLAWIGLAWEQAGWAKVTVPYTDTGVATKDGSAELAIEKGVPPISVWAAVDMESGQVALATPEGFPIRRMASGKPDVDSKNPGPIALSADRRGMLWAALVRPRAGAWFGRAGDGGPTDADGKSDGRINMRPATLSPLGSAGSPPTRVLPGDVIVVVDGETLEVFTDTVGAR